MGRRKSLATYGRLKPIFEELYDRCGLHWTQAMHVDNALFAACCAGVTKAKLSNLMDRLRREAQTTKTVGSIELESESNGGDEIRDPLDTAQSIFDGEFDFDDSYNLEEGEQLWQAPASPEPTHTHDDLPPFNWLPPYGTFLDCARCGVEWDILYGIPRGKLGPLWVCIKCLQAINEIRYLKGRHEYDIVELNRRYV